MSGFAGLDYDSFAVHVVTINENTLQPSALASYDLASGPGDAFERARRIRDLLPARGAWKDAGILAIGLEDVYTQQRNSLIAHKRVEGALLACLPRDLIILPLPAADWKRDVLGDGHGRATKEEIRAWAETRTTGVANWPQGLIDAYAIATATAYRWTAALARQRPTRGAA